MHRAHKVSRREPRSKREMRVRRDSSAVPIRDDPNNYCQLCRKTYSNKMAYHNHIETIHRNVLQEATRFSSNPDAADE